LQFLPELTNHKIKKLKELEVDETDGIFTQLPLYEIIIAAEQLLLKLQENISFTEKLQKTKAECESKYKEIVHWINEPLEFSSLFKIKKNIRQMNTEIDKLKLSMNSIHSQFEKDKTTTQANNEKLKILTKTRCQLLKKLDKMQSELLIICNNHFPEKITGNFLSY
jgi:hypothetical protein